MSIISFRIYKEKVERLFSDLTISEVEFDSVIEDLISQIPIGAMQLKHTPFLEAMPFIPL